MTKENGVVYLRNLRKENVGQEPYVRPNRSLRIKSLGKLM